MAFVDRYGPWAVIAGASEGTGSAFARKVAESGVNCVLIARREAPLAALADELRGAHRVDCVIASIDLAATDACERIVAAVGSREIGLFISNAGADTNGSRFLDRDISAWVELVQCNVMATMRCCHHFAAPMRARGKGGLLLVNSGACYGGASSMAAYSASKAFTLCLGEALWAELRPHGIDVLNLVLGRTDTPAFRKLLAEKGMPVPDNIASPEDVAQIGLARLPHGPVHNFGLADDVAGFAPNSAAARRERILMIDNMSKQVFGKG
jgi:uncharacterized protein